MARVLSVSADLMLGSRVAESLRGAGHEVSSAPAPDPEAVAACELVVADLEAAAPESLAGLGVPVLGYYSHVDAEMRRRAEAAGLDLVVPRSRMARELPELVGRLLAA